MFITTRIWYLCVRTFCLQKNSQPFLLKQSSFGFPFYNESWRFFSAIHGKTMREKLTNTLRHMELTAKQRNAFEQKTFPLMEILSATLDGLRCSFTIEIRQEMCHLYGGTLHAGITTSLMLDATALQATVIDPTSRHVLTISSSFDFLRPAKVGEELVLHTEILFTSQRFVTAEMRLMNADGKLISTGRHFMKYSSQQRDEGDEPTGMSFV